MHLDGSDLAPLLTRSGTFKRHQPLFWMNGANMVLRMGSHTLFTSGTARSPIDFKAANRLMDQIKEVLGDDLEKELGGMDFRSRLFNGSLANPEARRLQQQHRDLYYFNEAWIPELKKSGVGRVQLYDLSKDLGQQNDIAKERPQLVARMTKQAEAIYRSVLADAPEWLTPEELAAATKPAVSAPQPSVPAKAEAPTNPKKAMSAKLKELVDAGQITQDESIELYLAAFPEEEENVKKKRANENVAKLIQTGKFDSAPFDAVDLALSQSNPKIRGSALSAAFGRLGAGVGGVKLDAVVERLNSLTNTRDKDFAINGLAHGLVSSDPEAALKWANSISDEGFRKTVVENVTRRIKSQPSR